jgi:serine/threonine-protein kinase
LDSSRWQRVLDLFHSVSDLPPASQAGALRAKCGGDETLMDEVLAMLEQDREEAGVLDLRVADLASHALGDLAAAFGANREIGPYRIERVLGEGGMGTVFLATRADLGSAAAIKILRDAWISPARRRRFALEQRTLARLSHPNIARLLDADTLDDGTPYFVMEYVDGVPLDEHCERHGCSVQERLRLFRSVCEAVQFAHQHAVIHRDLKPSNILVTAAGEVKLLDFGIAKHLSSLDLALDQTRTGLRLLTPAYASPEQVLGGSVGVGTDVYSLGVILYQLLSGRLPFDVAGRTPAEALEMISRSVPVKPSLVARRVREQAGEGRAAPGGAGSAWDDLDVLCLTAMHRDIAKRYGSVEALIRDTGRYLRGKPLEARPDTLGYRLGKFVRRNRKAVAASAGVLAAVAVIVAFFAIRLAAERNSVLAGAARVQRIQSFMLNLFQGGDGEAGPAHDLRVLTLLDRGVQEAASLDQDPAIQAELLETLGGIYHKLGQLDRAGTLLDSALNRRRSLSPTDPAIAGTLVALGLLRVDQARLDDAERLVRQGLDLTKRTRPPGHPAVAAALDALGRVLEEKGDYGQAIPVLEQAVKLRSVHGGSPADLAASQYELANVFFYAGRYEESEKLNRQVLELNRRTYGGRHPRVAEALINLGAIQQDLGHYKEAERFHRQALEINRGFYGEDHFRTASNLTMIARSLVFQKRLDEAADLLGRAAGIQQRVFGENHPRVASAVNELGNIALLRGQYGEAKAAFERMARIYRAVYAGKHYLVGTALSNLASAYMAEKDNIRAERIFRQAIAMFEKTLPEKHVNIAIARIKLGRALLRQKRYAEARTETSAGYEILSAQANPSVSYLNSARSDLAEMHDALGDPHLASALRQELALAQGGK